MTLSARKPGAPLTALLAVLLLWVGARVVLWETPFHPSIELPAFVETLAEPRGPVVAAKQVVSEDRAGVPTGGLEILVAAVQEPGKPPVAQPPQQPLPTVPSAPLIGKNSDHRLIFGGDEIVSPRIADRSLITPVTAMATARPGRWSLDAWVLGRGGDMGTRADGPILPTYGASQAGAVVRYRLNGSAVRPTHAYLRVNAALGNGRERDAALGIAARPLARMPVALMAEARLSQRPVGTIIRPAVMLVSEFPTLALGAGARTEVYVQAGYVGGREATGFADGQARFLRDVVGTKRASLSIGGGAWGGLQRGAERIDVGPTAMLDLRIGTAAARLAIDYRIRAAGDALPKSGPAITLSTGF